SRKSDETAFPIEHLLLTENQTEHQMGTRRFKLFAGCFSPWGGPAAKAARHKGVRRPKGHTTLERVTRRAVSTEQSAFSFFLKAFF
ncbi:hypothetical protein, partial [Aurantimonas sp. A3-2-R12]|uniref:hypothetical protein n=1 Tax=Aurantimonas sp. A3-2-R12 TaxID=3114362 RepID=UPI002E194849|nr:hypothetical protein [Aurantimonas sp. A3-2-R12]